MKNQNSKFHSITQSIKFITGILSWVILVILVLIAGFLVYYFVSVKIYSQKGEDYRPNVSLFTILTNSMEPNINPNDVVIDVKVNKEEDIKKGDVITFISVATLTKGMTITHRVTDMRIEQGEMVYFTKGDNNLSPDPVPVPFSNVLGKVVLRIPQLGLLQRFLATRGGWLIVVVIPALFIIISDVLKIFRLKTAKDQVEETLIRENTKNKQLKEKKEQVSQKLEKRYKIERKTTEPDPLPKKNYIVMTSKRNSSVVTKDDLPKRIDLPKLKSNSKNKKKNKKK